MNSKNELQEIYQKIKKPLPKYKSIKTGNSSNDPKWVSTVTIYDGRFFIGFPNNKKKFSEFSAAKKALDEIKETGIIITYGISYKFTDKKIIILVDVENKPNFMKDFSNNIQSEGIKIIGFVSEKNIRREKTRNGNLLIDRRMKIIEVPTTRVDGADVGLCFLAGSLVNLNYASVFIIISEDHFAEALSDCIRNHLSLFAWKINSCEPKKLHSCVCHNFEETVEKLDCLFNYGSFTK